MDFHKKQILLSVILTLISCCVLIAQHDSLSATQQLGSDGYREGQYPGLDRIASGNFYSEKRVTLSGYTELANVFNGELISITN